MALVGKTRTRTRRENESARTIPPAKRGRGTAGARVASEPSEGAPILENAFDPKDRLCEEVSEDVRTRKDSCGA